MRTPNSVILGVVALVLVAFTLRQLTGILVALAFPKAATLPSVDKKKKPTEANQGGLFYSSGQVSAFSTAARLAITKASYRSAELHGNCLSALN